ncbi:MAG: prolipoprotein diacylglyceryl transferase family protein [Dehalococcoidia bacterium]
MTISVDPQVFGSPLITWVAVFSLAGIVVGLFLILRYGAATRQRREVYSIGLWAILWGLVGARALHVLDFWGFYSEVPFQSLYLWNGGLSLWGALVLGGGGALWHARRRGLATARFVDSLAVAGLAGIVVGRVGDLLSGERPGTGTSWPWAIEYTHPGSESYAQGFAAHPVAAYELLLALAVLGAVLYLSRRWPSILPQGAGLAATAAMLAVGRFAIGFVRTEPAVLGLTQVQWVAVAVLLATGVYAWQRRSRSAHLP